MPHPPCPLCQNPQTHPLHKSNDRHGPREFHQCPDCDLAFVPPAFHLPPDAEIQRYLMHDNNPTDPRYRAFLARLWNILKPALPSGASGLDFGCGPGPALAQMMREDGFQVNIYDLYFFPDPQPLTNRYDFITCTETLEHIKNPMQTLTLLDSILKPGGKLGIMTGILDDRATFPNWYYQRDPTHIAFYTTHTMNWIARAMNWQPQFPAPNIAIFTKPPNS